ncbi:5-formyltetrahydrofolate cyclo-ligase [Lacticaseibacillus yichunensis]|uniref:5-formyltetrahydrofolate cyclo-ligase n=1 Tax=Lacticaseibacillus yichunensis TaxID=2486015 RepID=A0ABW4CQ31_9LACO|nr:5-formyltetrahydrofolate cyclo-ligase [Lacticaseibacillus yichunensis]
MLSKVEFRKQQLPRLKSARQETEAAAAQLLYTLMTTPAWKNAQTIATTISGPGELPTAPLIEAATQAGKTVLLPRVLPKRQLVFLPDPGPAARVTSSFGLSEPAFEAEKVEDTIDLIIVPGLAFASFGRVRVGFGGGYYDRFLAAHPASATIALVPPVMQFALPTWDVEPFDVPLDQILFV